MDTKDLKASIYKLLESTDDTVVLEDIREYISQRKQGIVPELGCTLEEYNRDLDEAMKEIEQGKFVDHDEAMKGIDDMLNRMKK
jgi:hypothetical protein